MSDPHDMTRLDDLPEDQARALFAELDAKSPEDWDAEESEFMADHRHWWVT